MINLKVLFITNIPSPYRVDFFNELSSHCELTVLYEREKASDRDAAWQQKHTGAYETHILPGVRIREDAAFCPSVLRFLKKGKYDIVVIGGYATPTAMLAITVLRLKGIPFILNADGGMVPESEASLKRKIKKFFIKKASWWLSTGKTTSEYLIYYGANPDNIFIYPFTSLYDKDIIKHPISQREKSASREKLGMPVKALILGVGQFIPRKGFLELLQEWTKKERDDIGLVLIGGGEQYELYDEIARQHKNIWILPFMKKEKLLSYYHAADVFVLPTKEDIWGLVINEALAAALPVFSTDKCVAALTLESECVRVVPAAEYATMVERLIAFVKAEDKDKLGFKALELIRPYTIENMAKVHIDIFKKIQESKI